MDRMQERYPNLLLKLEDTSYFFIIEQQVLETFIRVSINLGFSIEQRRKI